jgi:hypothetical protein
VTTGWVAIPCVVCGELAAQNCMSGVCSGTPVCRKLANNLSHAKARAAKRGTEFSITGHDVWPMPERCPVLGFLFAEPVNGRPTRMSAALDEIIPGKGYVPGNVQWLSQKANAMKQDATPEELRMFAEWILSK